MNLQTISTSIPITLQKSLHIRPRLHRVHQSRQPRVLLQPLSPILRQTFIVADLVEHQIRIRDVRSDDVRSGCGGEIVGFQMGLQGVEELWSHGPLMLGIGFFLVVGKEGLDEESAP